MDQARYDFPQRTLNQSLPDIDHPPRAGPLHDPVKDCFLVTKSRVHAGAVDSHGFGQVGYGCAFVAEGASIFCASALLQITRAKVNAAMQIINPTFLIYHHQLKTAHN
jgi:hypothetical protein